MKPFVALLALAATLSANPPKVGIVDAAEISKKYTKAIEQQGSIQKSIDNAKVAVQEKVDEVQRLQADLQETQKRAQSPLLSDSGKQQITQELRGKEETFRQRYTALQQLDQEARTTIQGRVQEMSRAIDADLRPAVEKVAKAKGLQLVLPKGAAFYADGSLDITEAVLAELNANHKPAAPAGPAEAPKADAKK
jgi:Skp family chaperone for outer membrane proteins